ncbi:MAG: BMP family ABC transporter substrate-binding protein, partial [Eubacteriaceae bacterium]|nr:BMP family ABC transporter substrate-binding protein [Eubacteriaceae bacterium]
MLKKNAIIALFALAAIALASASCAKQEVIIVPSVAYLEDLQGLGSSFPESVQETIEEINKERQFSYTVVKSKTDAELKKHARNFLKESGLVFATSYSADKALMDAATEDDESIAVCIGSNEPGSNVCRMTIRTEEASFFAGVIAAKETKTGVVAYLGG